MGLLVPVVPPCWTTQGRGARAPAARRARGRRDRGLVLALPPPIRLSLPELAGNEDRFGSTTPPS